MLLRLCPISATDLLRRGLGVAWVLLGAVRGANAWELPFYRSTRRYSSGEVRRGWVPKELRSRGPRIVPG